MSRVGQALPLHVFKAEGIPLPCRVEALTGLCYSFRFKGGQHNGTAENLQELH